MKKERNIQQLLINKGQNCIQGEAWVGIKRDTNQENIINYAFISMYK